MYVTSEVPVVEPASPTVSITRSVPLTLKVTISPTPVAAFAMEPTAPYSTWNLLANETVAVPEAIVATPHTNGR
jgi:hypothetical protein